MKLLPLLACALLPALAAGCISASHPLPDNAAQQLRYQLSNEPRLLVIPVCDYGDSIAIANPRLLDYPYRKLETLEKECNPLSDLLFRPFGERQPARLLILTPKGELFTVAASDRELRFAPLELQRRSLGEASGNWLLNELKAREFTISETDSPWLAPEPDSEFSPKSAEALDSEGDWSKAIAFIEAIKFAKEENPVQQFDRERDRRGVYCSAKTSHIKPDYRVRSILEVEYAPEKPVRINGAEFTDPAELAKALRIHLKSGDYALIRLKPQETADQPEPRCSGIAPLLRELADEYGSDFVIEMPDRTTWWHCARCFAQE